MLAGSLAILLAALAWATGSLYLRKADMPESPALSTGMQMLTGGAILTALGLLRGEGHGFNPAEVSSPRVWPFSISPSSARLSRSRPTVG